MPANWTSACAVSSSTPGWPGLAVRPVVHIKAILAWMDKRRYARAPAHWLVLNASQLNARHFWNRIGGGNSKDVYQTRLNTSAATPVVTKVGHYRWSDDRHKASEIVREMLYLEYLRGLPGVPLLLGAYHSGSGNNKTTTLVVRDSGGRRVITGGLHPYKKEHPSELYTKLAQEQPLALALAILSCFQSFAERGGCLLFDFTPRQFTVSHVNSTVRFELVDVPSVAAGPLYEALYRTAMSPRWCGAATKVLSAP